MDGFGHRMGGGYGGYWMRGKESKMVRMKGGMEKMLFSEEGGLIVMGSLRRELKETFMRINCFWWVGGGVPSKEGIVKCTE